jgi:hypothetical protein
MSENGRRDLRIAGLKQAVTRGKGKDTSYLIRKMQNGKDIGEII